MTADLSRNGRTATWFIVLSIIPIVIFFSVFFQYISNIPFQDDYDALLEPVTKFTQLAHFSWRAFVEIVWTQDDERRIVVDRLVAISTYLLINKLDLRLQAFLGLLSLVGIFYLVYTIIRDGKLPFLLLLTCSLLLFHIQYYETIFWAMIPLQHILVYFFVLLASFFLYSSKPFHLLLALVFAIFAILSDVSGTFILPVGLLLLLLQHRWKHSIVWVLLIGGMVFLYYQNFAVPSFRPKLSDNLQRPDLILGRILVASGLSFDANTLLPPRLRVGLIMAVGAALWAVVLFYGFMLLKSAFTRAGVVFARWESTLWGGLFHFSVTLLALAVGRAVEGIDPLLISRYKHIGFIWLILVILLVASKLKPGRQLIYSKVWLVVSTCLFLFSYFYYLAPLDFYYKDRYTDIYGWKNSRTIPSTPIYISLRPAIDSVTSQAIRAGVYQLPERYFFDGPYQKKNDTLQVKTELIGGHTLSFVNDSFTRSFGKKNGAFIVLKSDAQQQIIPTQQNRYSLKFFLFSLGRNYYANGFSAVLASKYLVTNQKYQVFLLEIDGENKRIYPTNSTIETANDSVRVISL
ncbi:hypothetical protein GO730_36570 [Spirosoma sp. HMF3257]|uniref:Glycosyltransferase RgtA/B/C/D-like domain-containing protein n=1 Tax=Spirosoma telluris TaxID=2183553 RepID=A0A327NS85_9BACT|nr:hypothetical protein [Spirosoma telluris]RAI78220.1 hypothetical protein HMF3257_36500 [Spirosoma telluris]